MSCQDDGYEQLSMIGWTQRLSELFQAQFGDQVMPGRVTRVDRGLYTVMTNLCEQAARITGAFEYRIAALEEYPVVGDWVAVSEVDEPAAPLRVSGCMARSSAVRRRDSGEAALAQVLAANVDLVLITFSLDGGRRCNPRAAERYATIAWESGAVPVILLNKTDIAANVEQSAAEISAAAPGVELILSSGVTGAGLAELRRLLARHKTAVLIGPSGSGKSTLVNALTGSQLLRVGKLRKGDLRGRHTTVARQLVPVQGGGAIIDTPGLRELQPWAAREALDASFSDVAEIAAGCRYGDCTHTVEPGCAVQAALADGALEFARFANYLELVKEDEGTVLKSAEQARREREERWKKIHQQARGFTKERRAGG